MKIVSLKVVYIIGMINHVFRVPSRLAVYREVKVYDVLEVATKPNLPFALVQ